VLPLVNTPDIYNENKYQRRNLLLYHCLLDSGLRKFNVSRQLVDGQKFYCVTLFCAFKQYRLSYVAHTMAASVNQLITFYIVKPLFLKIVVMRGAISKIIEGFAYLSLDLYNLLFKGIISKTYL
jgi:hypothetical protein